MTFGGTKQRRTDTSPPRSPMHKHLGDVRAMRLILRLSQYDLNRTDYRPGWIVGGEHNSFTARHARGDAVPVSLGFGAGHGKHEADRRTPFYAVDQHIAQLLNLANIDGLKGSNLNWTQHDFIS
jgi:hypothetical protein